LVLEREINVAPHHLLELKVDDEFHTFAEHEARRHQRRPHGNGKYSDSCPQPMPNDVPEHHPPAKAQPMPQDSESLQPDSTTGGRRPRAHRLGRLQPQRRAGPLDRADQSASETDRQPASRQSGIKEIDEVRELEKSLVELRNETRHFVAEPTTQQSTN